MTQTNAWGSSFKTRRIVLQAGVAQEVFPPGNAQHSVQIGNATQGDLRVYTEDPTDNEKYFIIVAGYERTIPAYNVNFSASRIAFWLKADVDGSAVLIWV